MLGRGGFLRKLAPIVGWSPVGDGPFVCRSSSFRQDFWNSDPTRIAGPQATRITVTSGPSLPIVSLIMFESVGVPSRKELDRRAKVILGYID